MRATTPYSRRISFAPPSAFCARRKSAAASPGNRPGAPSARSSATACTAPTELEIRSSKSEIRKKSEVREPNAVDLAVGAGALFPPQCPSRFQRSDFGLLSGFGKSDFGFRAERSSLRCAARRRRPCRWSSAANRWSLAQCGAATPFSHALGADLWPRKKLRLTRLVHRLDVSPYQRPKLSDPAHGTHELQPWRSRQVRCNVAFERELRNRNGSAARRQGAHAAGGRFSVARGKLRPTNFPRSNQDEEYGTKAWAGRPSQLASCVRAP